MKKIKKILLVEDDQVSAFLAKATIEETGFVQEIIYCANGSQAIDYLINSNGEHLPEVILLDLKMPVMDGYEFLKEYMEIDSLKGKNIRVVVLSSASAVKEMKRIEHLPISAYIEKPIDENKLAEVLSSLTIKTQL